jgi:hypothetical protein
MMFINIKVNGIRRELNGKVLDRLSYQMAVCIKELLSTKSRNKKVK